MTRTEVAILGGGLAGLNAARVQHQAGIAVQLFEARDRLGGRILTVGETCTPDSGGFDLGPSWFWPRMQPELATLVTELGIRSFGQHSAGDLLFERSLREPPQRANGAGQDQGSMRLTSGTSALVQALAKDLPVECACTSLRRAHSPALGRARYQWLLFRLAAPATPHTIRPLFRLLRLRTAARI